MNIPPQPVLRDLRAFKSLLYKLSVAGSRQASARRNDLYAWVDDLGMQVQPERVGWLPDEESLRGCVAVGSYVLLPLTADSVSLPVLSYEVDYRRTVAKVQLRLVLVTADEEAGYRTAGLRWESPEGPGEHHYYHCQWFYTFRDKRPLPNGYRLPASYPAIPVSARSASELLFSMTLSLYGLEYMGKVLQCADVLGSMTGWRSNLEAPAHDFYNTNIHGNKTDLRVWQPMPPADRIEKRAVTQILKAKYGGDKKMKLVGPVDSGLESADDLRWTGPKSQS